MYVDKKMIDNYKAARTIHQCTITFRHWNEMRTGSQP